MAADGRYERAAKRLRLTALQLAAENGHAGVILHLLDHGANIEAKKESHLDRTALHLAAQKGRANAVLMLLERDANIKAEDKDCRIALHLVSAESHAIVVRILLPLKKVMRMWFENYVLKIVGFKQH